MKTIIVFLILLLMSFFSYGQVIEDKIDSIVRKAIREEAVKTDVLLNAFEDVVRRVVDEKFPVGPVTTPVNLLKITSPVNNYVATKEEIISVELDDKNIPDKILQYKVYLDEVLKDTDGTTYTPALFRIPSGTHEIKAEAITLSKTHTAKIKIKVE
jgi:hypothetical protein